MVRHGCRGNAHPLEKGWSPGPAWHAQFSARARGARGAALFPRGGALSHAGRGCAGYGLPACLQRRADPAAGLGKLAYTLTMERAGFCSPAPCRRDNGGDRARPRDGPSSRRGPSSSWPGWKARSASNRTSTEPAWRHAASRLPFRGRARMLAAMAGVGVRKGRGSDLFLSALLSASAAFPAWPLTRGWTGWTAGPAAHGARGRQERGAGVTFSLVLGVEGLPLAEAASEPGRNISGCR